jgi:hypothetical protein
LSAGVEVAVDAQAELPLLDRLALPMRLHERHGTRTLVVFDEFQDVLSAKDRVDAVIRSEIQHHGDAARYIFAGSHVGMMRELFADRRRAFYGQAAPVELPPLPADDVANYIAARFEQTGRDIGQALEPLLALGQGHPQRTTLLAHAVWDLTASGETATEETWQAGYKSAMDQVRDELRAIWTALPTSHRRVLTTVAENTTPSMPAAAATAARAAAPSAPRSACSRTAARSPPTPPHAPVTESPTRCSQRGSPTGGQVRDGPSRGFIAGAGFEHISPTFAWRLVEVIELA